MLLNCVLQLDQFVGPRDVTAEQPSDRDMSGVVFVVVQSDQESLPPKLRQSGVQFWEVDSGEYYLKEGRKLCRIAPSSAHQALISAVLSPFAAWFVSPVFVLFARLLLEAQNSGCSVICLVSALVQRTGQDKLVGRRRLAVRRSIAAINAKQDGYTALLTANSEIPPRIDPGPIGNVHKSCPLPMRCRNVARAALIAAIAKMASVH